MGQQVRSEKKKELHETKTEKCYYNPICSPEPPSPPRPPASCSNEYVQLSHVKAGGMLARKSLIEPINCFCRRNVHFFGFQGLHV